MALSKQDVAGIADYARIALDDEELEEMCRYMNETVQILQPIREYDLEGVEPTFHPIGSLSNVMREDVEVPGLTQEQALSNAPAAQDGSFLIPSILGEGGDR